MKVALAGGGTGGHVYPALAMGDALKARGHEVIYIGDASRLEGRVAPQRGYSFYPVTAPQFPRSGVVGKVRFAFSLFAAILRARTLLQKLRPDVVLGVGGYIMAPTVLAARSLGIGRVIHESNVAPGLANRLCAKVSDLVLLTYAASGPKLGTRAPMELVGCPVHPKILQGDRAQARAFYGLNDALPVVLLVGGSLGAATLNALALASARLSPRPYQLLWITGPRYHPQALSELGEAPPGVVVREISVSTVDELSLLLEIAEDAAAGKRELLLTSGSVSLSVPDAFEVLGGDGGPRLLTLSPESVRQGERATLCVTASAPFYATPSVSLGEGVVIESTTLTAVDTASAELVVEPQAALGDRVARVDDGRRLYTNLSVQIRDNLNPPTGSCATSPAGGAGVAVALVLSALRRRRRSPTP